MAVLDLNAAQVAAGNLTTELKEQKKVLINQINYMILKIDAIEQNEYYQAEADVEDKANLNSLRSKLVALTI